MIFEALIFGKTDSVKIQRQKIEDMRRDSIQRRLIASVLLSQAILTAGLMVIGVVVTYWRLLSTLDIAMQAHATLSLIHI